MGAPQWGTSVKGGRMRQRILLFCLAVSVAAGAAVLLAPTPAFANGCPPETYCAIWVAPNRTQQIHCAYDGSNCFCPAIAEIAWNNCPW